MQCEHSLIISNSPHHDVQNRPVMQTMMLTVVDEQSWRTLHTAGYPKNATTSKKSQTRNCLRDDIEPWSDRRIPPLLNPLMGSPPACKPTTTTEISGGVDEDRGDPFCSEGTTTRGRSSC